MKPSDHLVAHAGIPQAALLLDAPSLCLLLDRQVELVHVRIKPCHNVLVAWRDVATGEHGWTEATGELTPKMSLRRTEVMKKYATEIDSIYL